MVEDWDRQKCKKEEEIFNRLEEAELQLCAASVMKMTAEEDNQGQVIMNSGRMPELATKFKTKKLEENPFKTETELNRPSILTLLAPKMTKKMTKPEMTAPASSYQTEPDGSTTLTRRVKEITDKIESEQHSNLSSAIILGTISKNFITKPIQVLCSQSETRCVSEPVCGPIGKQMGSQGT